MRRDVGCRHLSAHVCVCCRDTRLQAPLGFSRATAGSAAAVHRLMLCCGAGMAVVEGWWWWWWSMAVKSRHVSQAVVGAMLQLGCPWGGKSLLVCCPCLVGHAFPTMNQQGVWRLDLNRPCSILPNGHYLVYYIYQQLHMSSDFGGYKLLAEAVLTHVLCVATCIATHKLGCVSCCVMLSAQLTSALVYRSDVHVVCTRMHLCVACWPSLQRGSAHIILTAYGFCVFLRACPRRHGWSVGCCSVGWL